jgi:hypothetical protein
MVTISDFLHIKVNLKKKLIYMLTLEPKGDQTKYWKLFYWRFFPFATGVAPLAANISMDFRKGPNGILRSFGETDSRKKTWSRKSHGTVHLKWCFYVHLCRAHLLLAHTHIPAVSGCSLCPYREQPPHHTSELRQDWTLEVYHVSWQVWVKNLARFWDSKKCLKCLMSRLYCLLQY